MPEDFVWVISESCGRYRAGEVVGVPTRDQIVNDRALVPFEDTAVVLRRVLRRDLEEVQQQLAGDAGGPEEEDVRSLPVRWNASGERYRTWENLVEVGREDAMADWPLAGPRTTLWMMRHMLRNGGSPAAFFGRATRDLRLQESDRSSHELELILNFFELAGGVDQLHLSNLVSVELLSRRLQLILDANSGSGPPVWEGSEHFLGLGKRAKGIAPSLSAHVASRLKDEAEVEKQRVKAREVRQSANKGGNKGNKAGQEEK